MKRVNDACVTEAGLLTRADLAGYRNGQVSIRNSMQNGRGKHEAIALCRGGKVGYDFGVTPHQKQSQLAAIRKVNRPSRKPHE